MIGRLNHVGVAVPSIEAAKATYRDLYGVAPGAITDTRDMPEQGVRYAFVNVANSQIELLEPLGENSPILKFLERNPRGGQHHICFEVPDIYAASLDLKEKGAGILGAPRIGAHGMLVIFVHPKNSDGVLIELMEAPHASDHNVAETPEMQP